MEPDRLLSLVRETELRPSFPRYELFILIAAAVVCVPLPANVFCAAILTIITLRVTGKKEDCGGSDSVSALFLRNRLARNIKARFTRNVIHTVLTVLLFRYSNEIFAQLFASSQTLQEDAIKGGNAIGRLTTALVLIVIMCGCSAAVRWFSIVKFSLKIRASDIMGPRYP